MLNKYGIGLEQVRTAIAATNANTPKGQIVGRQPALGNRRERSAAEGGRLRAADRRVSQRRAGPRFATSARADDSVEDIRTAGYVNGKPAVMVIVFRQPGANIIETVDGVRAVLPQREGRHLRRRSTSTSSSTRRRRSARRCATSSARCSSRSMLVDPRGVCLPAQPADGADSERRRAAVAHRHVRRHVSARLQPRQPLADGADDLHRLRRRRRDRRDREHHAVSASRARRRSKRRSRARRKSASRCCR